MKKKANVTKQNVMLNKKIENIVRQNTPQCEMLKYQNKT